MALRNKQLAARKKQLPWKKKPVGRFKTAEKQFVVPGHPMWESHVKELSRNQKGQKSLMETMATMKHFVSFYGWDDAESTNKFQKPIEKLLKIQLMQLIIELPPKNLDANFYDEYSSSLKECSTDN